MTDLQINVKLALAMGWVPLSNFEWINLSKTGFIFDERGVVCSYEGNCFSKQFDYRDPVIFVAICKHWKLRVNHAFHWVSDDGIYNNQTSAAETLEKAAALCVIAAAKRGVK
jgi:hypothetical protein